MKDTYPSIHGLVQTILEQGKYPGSTVIADLDGDDYEDLPLVAWRTLNEGQVSHGVWRVILIVNVMFDLADTDMDTLLPHIYKQIRGWDTPGQGIIAAEKIGVESVNDGAVFDLIHIANLNGKNVSQFASQFELTIRDWS
ncbi:MAG: hypothetical protein KKF42_07420 [Actinobacteria bacterium]|nr:hypothetical protein [Actinomycetota bacterium]